MRFKRDRVVLLAIILISLSIPVVCLAARFNIKPKVSAGWRVDNNYYRAEATESEREVETYLIQPGIELGIETAKSELLLDYTLDAYYYDDKDTVPPSQRASDENDYVGHIGILEAGYRPFDRVLLRLENHLYKTRDPAYSDTLSNAVDREKYVINRLTPMILYEFGPKFSIGLRYRNTETNYSRTSLEDSSEHRGIFDMIYNFTRTAALDLEYNHWERDYDRTTSDYTSDQLMLIFRKQFKALAFEAGGGYQDRNFDDSTVEDIDTFTYRIAITGQTPPEPETPRSHISLAAELNLNDQGLGEEYYKAHRVSLTAGHRFLEKLLVSITGYYQKSDYENTTGLTPEGTIETRDDDTYDISGRIGCMFTDWLTLSITAGYEERDSNLAGHDYDNNYYIAELQFGHRLGAK